MPSTQQFRKRIRSVSNTSQITRAMEMVASVKMQKAVRAILSARSYTQNAWNMLATLSGLTSAKHSLLEKHEGGRSLLIIAGADRGLCGSYNSDLMRKTIKYQQDSRTARQSLGFARDRQDSIDVVAAGKKAADIAKKLKLNLVAEFPSFELDVEFWESRPISKLAIDGYASKTYDRVDIIYSHFISSLKQTPVIKQILPIDRNHIDLPELWETNEADFSPSQTNGVEMTEYKLEPNVDAILDRIVPQFIRAVVYGLFLESNASEQSARMVAMKNATDNARDLIDDLTLTYNSIRQDSITREIAEISGAAEAMK